MAKEEKVYLFDLRNRFLRGNEYVPPPMTLYFPERGITLYPVYGDFRTFPENKLFFSVKDFSFNKLDNKSKSFFDRKLSKKIRRYRGEYKLFDSDIQNMLECWQKYQAVKKVFSKSLDDLTDKKEN